MYLIFLLNLMQLGRKELHLQLKINKLALFSGKKFIYRL